MIFINRILQKVITINQFSLLTKLNKKMSLNTTITATNTFSQNAFSSSSIVNNETNNENSNSIAGICHLRSLNDKNHNLQQVKKITELAKSKNVKFLFFPECCDFVGENRDETIQLAEPLNGYIVKQYKELAKNHQIWLSFGGIHELIEDKNGKSTGKIYNTHIVINDCGDIIATYRKLHLFDVDTPDFKFRESKIVAPGLQIEKPIKTPIGNLGLQICYDMRFPEVSVILRKLGAEILTYPSAFAYTTGKAHWEILLRSRAIENQCYVIASAQVGYHNTKRQSYGNAMIINPWGEIIAKCNNDNENDLSYAEIDLKILHKTRNNMPCFNHRRDDIYSLYPIQLSSYNEVSNENRSFAQHIIPSATIFYETEYCFCFTNIRCVVPGHVLVATKRNVKRLNGLLPIEITDLFQTVVKIEKYLEKFYNATSMTVTVQDGADAGQTVEHVHFHVMPRHKNDFPVYDDIYIKLQSHDHNPENARRPLNEMIQEAQNYREFIQKNPIM